MFETLHNLAHQAGHIIRTLWGALHHRNARTRLVTIHLSYPNLIHNLKQFETLSPHIFPVLKANAYGHGLTPIAHMLERAVSEHAIRPLPYIAIDSLYEAEVVRRAGIHTPLLVLGYTEPADIVECTLSHITFMMISRDQIERLVKKISPHREQSITIHLKIDTGMSRHGITTDDIEHVRTLLQTPHLTLTGLATHFMSADDPADPATHAQIKVWEQAYTRFSHPQKPPLWCHISNSAGHGWPQPAHVNASRLGLGLYGVNPDGPDAVASLTLKPVLTMTTRITSTRRIHAGTRIGYNGTFTATHDMTIATLPVGYYEGIDRRLSNAGSVNIHGIDAPIIGRVSMNITTIDISHIPQAVVGDEVIALGDSTTGNQTFGTIAKLAHGAIPYDIMTGLPQHIKRVVEG
jgi:alanine racemase